MKKNTRLQNFGLVLAGAVSASLLWHAFGVAGAASNADTYKQLNLFGDVFDRVRSDYVEEPDEQQMIEAAINGMLASLDPHSSYMNKKQFQDMSVQTRGEFGGLGIEVTQEDGFVKVVSPMDDTPAAAAGSAPPPRFADSAPPASETRRSIQNRNTSAARSPAPSLRSTRHTPTPDPARSANRCAASPPAAPATPDP